MISRIDLRVIIILAVIIGIGGCVTLAFMYHKDAQLREQILTETRLAAAGIDFDTIRTFDGSDADLTNPAYISMKEKMVSIKAAEPLSRFVYIMGQRDDGGVFFYVDSEPPGSEGYSPPGQDYTEVSDQVRELFTTGKTGIVGPTTDRWGTWISGLLPIQDPKTGTIIGVFGIDIDAGNWTAITLYTGLPPLVGTLLIVAIFLSFITINRRKDEENRKLAISEQALRESESRLSAILQSSPAFQFVIDHNHTVISWNRALEKFSGIPASEMIGTKNHWKAFFPTERPLLVDVLLDRNYKVLNELYGDSCHPSDLVDGAYEMTRFYPEMKENGIWLYILRPHIKMTRERYLVLLRH
ncbi:PAS domain S-box protein [Methanospirillum hungatei]|uniref:PAS domain S-box protein n=1 Tax=Methanospirillum hungatei TaxID=2203 RepID=UPI0026EB3C75|nr:PAS domain S-box protein [Methanospirillum hungatei]MCA1915210.1 PAS domain S-box protein [Methanospirillum hungatei]